ncbi:MAG TPA: hypothetical protein VK420_03035 [Longimicrobium sp.]|nr:hypothetical protein [Longimicrobium sp.]
MAAVVRLLRAFCLACILLGGSARATPLIPLGEAAWRAAESLESRAPRKPIGRSSEYFLSARTLRDRAIASSGLLPAESLAVQREASSGSAGGEPGSALEPGAAETVVPLLGEQAWTMIEVPR